VANYYGNSVSVIDGSSNTVIATVPVGTFPQGVGVNPTTNRIYVANQGGNTVSVIDGTSNTVIATVPVGNSPGYVDVNPTTNYIYVANYSGNTVAVIDGTSNTVVSTAPVGNGPFGVGVNPTTNRVYVANSNDDTVAVLQGEVPGPGYASAPMAGSTLNVGKVKVGLPVTAALTISEIGNVTLNVISHTLSGSQAAEFSVSPASLSIPNGGAAQALFIRCTPGGLGLRTATLIVNHNAADSPATYTLNCTGQTLVYLPLVLK